MNEQQSIFDAGFDDNLYIRRRSLLPLAAKIYVWFFIVIGCVVPLDGFIILYNTLVGALDPGLSSWGYYKMRIAISFLSGLLFLLVGVPIWKEAKWAIRINWGFAVMMVASFLYNVFNFKTGVITDDITVFIPVLLFLPYWVMLYRIQKRWEQVASTKNK